MSWKQLDEKKEEKDDEHLKENENEEAGSAQS